MLPLSAEDPRTIGEFRLHARLGAGGMGRVYLASSPGGRAVAVKVVHPHLARDTAFLGRFRREVAAALAVNGGYAVPVVATGPDDDPPWLATAYVPGPSLHEVVSANGPMPQHAVLKLTAGLAEALRVIHDCGLVHRDLKPGNVLLATDGPRVIDFGIARALDGTVLTSAESLLGTPSFMSPEQAQGRPAGPASDVFSLGGVVYFAATGHYPFGTGHPAAMLFRIVHGEPELERMPPGLRDLTAACLAKDPAQRPAPAQLAAALMNVTPPGEDPATFWPAPMARLLVDYQARLGLGPPAGDAPRPATEIDVPSSGWSPAATAQDPGAAQARAAVAALGRAPGGYPDRAGDGEPTPQTRLDRPSPRAAPPSPPGLGRRRALASLAGMAAGGVVVAAFELARPGQAAGSVAGHLANGAMRPPPRPGTKIWSALASGPVEAIAVGDGSVFAGTAQNTVLAVNAATGKMAWQRATSHAFNTRLAVAGQAVVIADGVDGGLYALDAAHGQQLWSVKSSGVLGLATAGQAVYAGVAVKTSLTGGVTALSANGGDVLWTSQFPQSVDTNGGLALAGDTLYVTTQEGEIYAYSTSSGTKRWRISGRGVTFGAAPPVVAGGVLYVSSANSSPKVYAVHAANGRPIWQKSLGVAQFPAYLAAADDVVFAAVTLNDQSSGQSAGYLSALNAATGQQLWKVRVAGAVSLGPTVAGGTVYTGSNNGVLDAWQATTGNHLWSFEAADAIGTNIVASDGVVYFGSNDYHVYAVAAQR